ncbi:hypothetical protein ACFVYR_37765 [Streptomyces sp. NPDC058284]|uniref:hypothetical protein n=1 Tax=unclassified Streptomyces TaxID=2593676 RepID=UPI00365A7546
MVLMSREQFPVFIEFYALWLQEARAEMVDEEPDGPEQQLVTSHHGRVDIRSAGHTHEAAFTVEVWDAPPEPDRTVVWEAVGEGELDSATGQLQIYSYGGPSKHEISLGMAGQRWRLRVHVVGQEAVAELAEEDAPEGVECFLLQFWPV